jgi:hypothetical protein
MRVIGGGLGRTGTTSLKAALDQLLDGPCHHMIEVALHPEQVPVLRSALRGDAVDWPALLDGYEAVVDWPGVAFWRELTEQWPDALVLVSHRDFDAWYESATQTIFRFQDREPEPEDEFTPFLTELFGTRFTLDLDDRHTVKAHFDAHYAEVEATIPPERRLDWAVTDGWAPICAALDLPVPDEPFPRLNTRDEWGPRD